LTPGISVRRWRWLWLSLAVVAADRGTKYVIERFTTQSFRRDIIPNVVVLVHSMNPGIAFGLLSESASKWVASLLMVTSIAVILLLAYLLVTGSAGDPLNEVGFALITGGAAGNLVDRMLYGGVTDFLELHAGRFQWPAFNLADSAITVGAFLVGFALLRGRQHSRQERA